MSDVIEYKLSELKSLVLAVAALAYLSAGAVLLELGTGFWADIYSATFGIGGAFLLLCLHARQRGGFSRSILEHLPGASFDFEPLSEQKKELKRRGEL